jgi:excisionase family DNA binding protein
VDRQLTVSFPRELVDNLADAVAERLREQDGEQTPEGWLDSQAAAEYLCVPRRRIYDLTSDGRIKPDGRDGSKPLFRRETLDRYARSEDR